MSLAQKESLKKSTRKSLIAMFTTLTLWTRPPRMGSRIYGPRDSRLHPAVPNIWIARYYPGTTTAGPSASGAMTTLTRCCGPPATTSLGPWSSGRQRLQIQWVCTISPVERFTFLILKIFFSLIPLLWYTIYKIFSLNPIRTGDLRFFSLYSKIFLQSIPEISRLFPTLGWG